MEVYLDNSATTRCFNEVAQLAVKVMAQDYGNPSSMHLKGVEGEKYLRHAREVIAKNLKVNEKEILFTSGGTESDNMALTKSSSQNPDKIRSDSQIGAERFRLEESRFQYISSASDNAGK